MVIPLIQPYQNNQWMITMSFIAFNKPVIHIQILGCMQIYCSSLSCFAFRIFIIYIFLFHNSLSCKYLFPDNIINILCLNVLSNTSCYFYILKNKILNVRNNNSLLRSFITTYHHGCNSRFGIISI